MKKIQIIAILISTLLYSQKNYKLNIMSPSPNVSNLLANIEVPVSYETGVANVTVPIEQISIGNEFEFPISLNYQTSGIKVNQESSFVGLGWNLQAGGVISAMIVGDPDIQKRITNTPDFPSSMDGLVSSNLIKKLTANSTGYVEKDLQPDIFYYSCPGLSGKFLLKENGQAVLFPVKNLRIERYSNTGWKITDDKGIIYIFNDVEITNAESNTIGQDYTNVEGGGGVNYNTYVSSYYLSEIILTSGKNIKFTYIDESYIINQAPQKTQTYRIENSNISTSHLYTKITSSKTTINGKFLSSIVWDGGKVMFESGERKDLQSLPNQEKLPQKLNKISIYNKAGLVKSFILEYDYFNKCQSAGCIDDINSIRLKLLSVKECGADQVCNPPYEFKYDVTNNLPAKYLGSRDHWGYINNLQTSDNIPKFIDATEFFDSDPNSSEKFFFYDNVIILNGGSVPFYKYIDYRQRESNAVNMTLGTLTEIKYPTKGYTRFEFEPNTYSSNYLQPKKLTYNHVAIHLGGNNPTFMETKMFSSTYPVKFNFNMSINQNHCYDYTCYGCNTNPTFLGCYQTYGGNYISLHNTTNNVLYAQVSIDDYFNPPPVVYTPIHNVATQTPTVGTSSSDGLSNDYLYYPPGSYKLTVRKDMHTTEPVDGELTSISSLTDYSGTAINMIAGGLRIKSKALFDSNNQKVTETKYEYGDGMIYDIPKFHQFKTVYATPANFETGLVSPNFYCARDLNNTESRLEISSGLSNVLTNSHISYTSVKVSDYNQSVSKGYTKYFYSERKSFEVTDAYNLSMGTINGGTNTFCQSASPTICNSTLGSFEITSFPSNVFPPYYKIYNDANLSSIEKYNDAGKILNKKVFTYENIFTSNNTGNSVTGLSVSPVLMDYSKKQGCPNVNGALPLSQFTFNYIARYRMNTDLYKLVSENNTDYFYNSGIPSTISSTTNISYDATNINPLIKKNILPDNSIEETFYKYALEKGNQLMIDRNMIGIPLEITAAQTNGGITKTLDKSETIYPTSLPTSQAGGLILPLSSKSYDILNNIPSTDVTFDKYDEKGNILQYTAKDGVPVSVVWGYNGTLPISKVEGMTYNQLTAIGSTSTIISASNDDASDASKENLLLNALNSFRKEQVLIGQKITTYTYDPVIGVTSITPPSGIRETFVYDALGRLKDGNVKVKNTSGTDVIKTVKKNKYQYKQ